MRWTHPELGPISPGVFVPLAEEMGIVGDLTRFVVTETMHERKKVMVMNADAIVVLPGGAGSLDEFFEVLTWRQLGLHGKPIILLSVEDYWAPLDGLLRHVVDQGFADPSLLEFVETTTSASDTITALRRALS